jgi:hypothetical protein
MWPATRSRASSLRSAPAAPLDRVSARGGELGRNRRLFGAYLFKEQFEHAWTYTTEEGMREFTSTGAPVEASGFGGIDRRAGRAPTSRASVRAGLAPSNCNPSSM